MVSSMDAIILYQYLQFFPWRNDFSRTVISLMQKGSVRNSCEINLVDFQCYEITVRARGKKFGGKPVRSTCSASFNSCPQDYADQISNLQAESSARHCLKGMQECIQKCNTVFHSLWIKLQTKLNIQLKSSFSLYIFQQSFSTKSFFSTPVPW